MDGISTKSNAYLVSNEAIPEAPTYNGHFSAKNAVGTLSSGGENLKRSTLSWKGINVFAPIERPSICRRLCSKEANDEPGVKQILFDGKYKVSICFICQRQFV